MKNNNVEKIDKVVSVKCLYCRQFTATMPVSEKEVKVLCPVCGHEVNIPAFKRRETKGVEKIRSVLPVLRCLRCGHVWHPRRNQKPKNCPNPKCNSPYWDRERRRK